MLDYVLYPHKQRSVRKHKATLEIHIFDTLVYPIEKTANKNCFKYILNVFKLSAEERFFMISVWM